MQRKVTVILAADVVGFGRLIAEDEEETLRRLVSYRQVFDDFVGQYGGRIFNTAGDAVLAEFRSSVDAVRAAIDIQETLRTRNFAFLPSRQMLFRIGITVGDVVERDGDLLGDAVNVAARLQSLAAPGGIWISRAVHEQIANKMSIAFRDLGATTMKNIPTPVHVFAVMPSTAPGAEPPPAADRAKPRRAVVAGLLLAALLLGAGAWWSLQRRGTDPPTGQRGTPSGQDSRPPVAARAPAGFVAEGVPFLRQDNRNDLKDNYAPARSYKALALNRFGYGYAVAELSDAVAREKALAACRGSTGEPCELYALGDHVVWPHPPPPLPPHPWQRDIPGGAEPFDPDRVPFAREADRDLIASFARRPMPRALSMAENGFIGMSWGGASRDDPVRRSLEFCGDRAGEACLLVAVDDEFAVALPRTMAVIGLFKPEADIRLGAAGGEIAGLYAGPEWRAVAIGEAGAGATVGRAGEEDAIAAAMAECRRRTSGCRMHAIGPFRVGPKR